MLARDPDPTAETGLRARPADPVSDIKEGLPVYTADNEQLGRVKEVRERAFKVDVPMRPDYWLTREAVLSFTAERVTLTVNKDQVDGCKVDAP